MENSLGIPIASALPLSLLQDSQVLTIELKVMLIDNQIAKSLSKLWTIVSALFILKNNYSILL